MNALPAPAQAGLPLRDVHLPPNPSWWPPAPGWWGLLLVICVACVVGYLIVRRWRRMRRLREKVLAEVRQLSARHADDAAYAAALHQWLRRAARRYSAQAHQLQGEPWRQVLAQAPVDAGTIDTLMTLEARMYQPHASFDRMAAEAAAYRWLQAAWPRMRPLESGHA